MLTNRVAVKHGLRRHASFSFAAVMLLAGCAQPSPSPDLTASRISPAEALQLCPCVYVTNTLNTDNSVTVYATGFAGSNLHPIQTISGSHTELDEPISIAVDDNRNIYVANTAGARVTVYAAGATGNVSPIAVLSGANIAVPDAVSVDAAGNIYVLNYDSIKEYAPGASGNATPIRSIEGSKTKLTSDGGFAMDQNGNFYVAHFFAAADTSRATSITVYGAHAHGNVRPKRTIVGPKTNLGEVGPLAVDSSGSIYAGACCYTQSIITVYAAGAKGDAAPIRTISGSYTGLDSVGGVALDANQNLYVANEASNSIAIFAAGANGNVAPIRTISGSNTGLDYPTGVAIWPRN